MYFDMQGRKGGSWLMNGHGKSGGSDDNSRIMQHKQPLNDRRRPRNARAHEKENDDREGGGRRGAREGVALHARLWCVHRIESMTK